MTYFADDAALTNAALDFLSQGRFKYFAELSSAQSTAKEKLSQADQDVEEWFEPADRKEAIYLRAASWWYQDLYQAAMMSSMGKLVTTDSPMSVPEGISMEPLDMWERQLENVRSRYFGHGVGW